MKAFVTALMDLLASRLLDASPELDESHSQTRYEMNEESTRAQPRPVEAPRRKTA